MDRQRGSWAKTSLFQLLSDREASGGRAWRDLLDEGLLQLCLLEHHAHAWGWCERLRRREVLSVFWSEEPLKTVALFSGEPTVRTT